MQALIDYRGWRQWKDYSQNSRDDEAKDNRSKGPTSAAGGKKKKNRAASATSSPSASASQASMRESNGPVGLGLGVDSGDSSQSLQTENGDR
jgi:osomolarity two-component system response regulator SSK1